MEELAILRRLLAFALVLSYATADCMFYQDDCPVPGQPGCLPTLYPTPVPPFPLPAPPFGNPPCPMYNSLGCCTRSQQGALQTSFLGLNFAFGEVAAGGCPACLANAVSFWCQYTCGPNQTEFITSTAYANVTDPNTGLIAPVLQTHIRVDQDFGCATYASCAGTSSVQKLSDLASMEGFFDYQGNTEAIGHGMQIFFEYVNSTTSNTSVSVISQHPYSCCNYPIYLDSFPKVINATGNTSCPCSTCRSMCPGGECPWGEHSTDTGSGSYDFPDLGAVNKDPLLGCDWLTVGILYSVVAMASLAVLGYRMWEQRKSGPVEEGEDDETPSQPLYSVQDRGT